MDVFNSPTLGHFFLLLGLRIFFLKKFGSEVKKKKVFVFFFF